MFSTGEIIVLLGMAGLLIGETHPIYLLVVWLFRARDSRMQYRTNGSHQHVGPKELPVLARGAGRLTGRAAAFLSRSRAAFLKFSDDNEITEVLSSYLLEVAPPYRYIADP